MFPKTVFSLLANQRDIFTWIEFVNACLEPLLMIVMTPHFLPDMPGFCAMEFAALFRRPDMEPVATFEYPMLGGLVLDALGVGHKAYAYCYKVFEESVDPDARESLLKEKASVDVWQES
jgi:hypothetical protein